VLSTATCRAFWAGASSDVLWAAIRPPPAPAQGRAHLRHHLPRVPGLGFLPRALGGVVPPRLGCPHCRRAGGSTPMSLG